MSGAGSTVRVDRAAALDRFTLNRRRTRALFDVLDETMYYERPIPLRNPVVFYEGHVPAFSVNTLLRKALGQPGIDEHFERIFERGIDPATEASAVARGNPSWPSRQEVAAYAAAADRRITEAIATADLERADQPLLEQAQALWTILEHEEMHQETLAYIWHQMPYERKRPPAGYVTVTENAATAVPEAPVRVEEGVVTLGTSLSESGFGWDNERPVHRVAVDAFSIGAHKVTNSAFLDFVTDGGYRDPTCWREEDWAWVTAESVTHPHFWERVGGEWYCRGMFERLPLPGAWPVYVTWAEASAYARWRGLRLPTEAEYHRAAYGTSDGEERQFPWGDTCPAPVPDNFDFRRWDPEPVGANPGAVSALGVHGLVGNGWEWTSTVFGPFPGFAPLPSYPEYSADFFDGEHFVMKGASPRTARALVRRGFRNWFRPRYPYAYATFRCVWPA